MCILMEWKSTQEELGTIGTHMTYISWLMNLSKIEDPTQSVNFLGVTQTELNEHILQNVRNTLLSLLDLVNKQGAQKPLRFLRF